MGRPLRVDLHTVDVGLGPVWAGEGPVGPGGVQNPVNVHGARVAYGFKIAFFRVLSGLVVNFFFSGTE